MAFKELKILVGCQVAGSLKESGGIITPDRKSWKIRSFELIVDRGLILNNRIFKRFICKFCGASLFLEIYLNDCDKKSTNYNYDKFIHVVKLYREREYSSSTVIHSLHLSDSGWALSSLAFDSSGVFLQGEMGTGYVGSLRKIDIKNPDCFLNDGTPLVEKAVSSINNLTNDELAILSYIAPNLVINALPPGELGISRIKSLLEHLTKQTSVEFLCEYEPIPTYDNVWDKLANAFRENGDPKGIVSGLSDAVFYNSFGPLIFNILAFTILAITLSNTSVN